jgi:outer membrane murein-binding lipoprotein Lpp
MADQPEPPMKAPATLDDKVDALSSTVDGLSSTVDGLSSTVGALSSSVDERFNAVDKRFDAVDKRFDAMDKRFDAMDTRILQEAETTRRHFDIVAEQFKDYVKVLADGTARNTERLDDHEKRLQALEVRPE